MPKLMTTFAILTFILAAPVLLMAGSKNTENDHTLAAQIEQRLSGIPNTVIVVVDESTKTAFLRGTVSTQADMDRIMELVHSVDGVRVIGSNLTVLDEPGVITRDNDTVESVPLNNAPPEEGTTLTTTVITDSSLRSAVEEAIKSEGIKGQSMIKVETEDGVVTLTGTALSEAHADRIVALAQSVPGVVGVQTNIQLRDQKRVYKVKPSPDRDKEGREVGEGESRVEDDDR